MVLLYPTHTLPIAILTRASAFTPSAVVIRCDKDVLPDEIVGGERALHFFALHSAEPAR